MSKDQPGQVVQIQPRQEVDGCPSGSYRLSSWFRLSGCFRSDYCQRVEIFEVLSGFEMANKYDILNSVGQQCFLAYEESEFCMRQYFGPARSFTMYITNNMGQEVLRCTRECKFCTGCCWCADGSCGWELSIEAPVGNIIGYVRQQ